MRGRAAALAFLLLLLLPMAGGAAPPEAPSLQVSGAVEQGALLRGTAPPGAVALTLDGEPLPLDPERRFLFGLDRDRTGTVLLVARLAGGGTLERRLDVRPRPWRIEHIAMARPAGGPTEAFLRLREGELARIAAARARDTGAKGWLQTFRWPAVGRISGRFGAQRVYRGQPAAFHAGVDIAAGAGATVVAPADAVVVLAGPPAFSLEGNLVVLDHGMGLNSAFLHLATSAVVVGQRVRQGQPIGTVGMSGRATGPHLHWAMRWREARIDPAPLAGPMPR
ncbi:MAG: M23 family metallopeptidase [Alphaproteobacteria bacterium]|nr:M23 family metallopeptidase [Alphaproteobacteria bacterium]MBV9372508.1 M23 family metallopeptidase [Alphaproteobacteria bacterium]MBV9902263.1 M23 family metallopeptidase [Alphaproteobacteria bacterium]